MIEKLNKIREDKHLSFHDIADKAQLSESTVKRIFSGRTESPTLGVVRAIARSMGVKMSEIVEDDFAVDLESNAIVAPSAPTVETETAKHVADHDKVIEMYERMLATKDTWIRRLFWALATLTTIVLLFFIVDVVVPSIGYFRY